MTNNQCPLCGRYYCDNKMSSMNLDEPEYCGYCRKCRKGIKKLGFDIFCRGLEKKQAGEIKDGGGGE